MSSKGPLKPRRTLFLLFLIIVSICVFLFRFEAFGDMEPRGDQAFFSWWVQGLYQADHFLPDVEAGESWLRALKSDDGGFVHRILRPVYSKSATIFTFVPLALRYAMTWALGASYGAQVAMSVLASVALVVMLGLLPVCVRESTSDDGARTDHRIIGAIAVFLGATTFYLHIFSPWGNHNFGVLFLLIAVALGSRVLSVLVGRRSVESTGRLYTVAACAYGLAYYAHWTNVFLLPAATFFSIVAMPGLVQRKRLSIAIGFIVFSAALAIPFLIATVIEDSRNLTVNLHSTRGLAEIALGSNANGFLQNVFGMAFKWLEKGSHLFSAPGLALGVLGLAFWAQRERVLLPLFVVITHFTVWCALPIFAGAYLRTFLYVIPFLILGIAYLSVIAGQEIWVALKRKAIGGKAFAGVVVLGVLTVHIYNQFPLPISIQEIRNKIPEAWELYFSGQGSLKPAMAEIGNILPERAVAVTWGYGLQYLLRNYEIESSRRVIAPPLLMQIPWFEDGTLSDRIKRRRLSVPASLPMFTLIDHSAENIDRESIRQSIENVFGPKGFGIVSKVTLESAGHWHLDSSWPRDVALYRIETD